MLFGSVFLALAPLFTRVVNLVAWSIPHGCAVSSSDDVVEVRLVWKVNCEEGVVIAFSCSCSAKDDDDGIMVVGYCDEYNAGGGVGLFI